jgi:hypothetical protein
MDGGGRFLRPNFPLPAERREPRKNDETNQTSHRQPVHKWAYDAGARDRGSLYGESIMTPIPKDPETRQRLIRLHAECLASMSGVAGGAIVKASRPGDVTEISGGMLDDDLMRRVLIYMWRQPAPGKLVVICTKIEQEWRIARLPRLKGMPPVIIDDRIFTDEHSPQHAIFVMRLEEMVGADGA